MNIRETLYKITHRRQIKNRELARWAAAGLALAGLRAEQKGDTEGVRLFSVAAGKAVADFSPSQSSSTESSRSGSVR